MVRVSLILLLVSLMLTAVTSQTFQYSRGWTNGKRSNNNPNHGQSGFQSELRIANFPIQGFSEYSSELSTPSLSPSSVHCGLQKLKMMLQGNGNEEIYLLPCELLGEFQRSYQQQQLLQQRRRLYQ